MTPKKSVNVVGAVIIHDGLVLCAQRGSGALANLWEFPGGKIEPSETAQEALAREIEEELNCSVKVRELVTTTTHEYDFAIVTLTTFYCDLLDGEPQATEHAAVRWLQPDQLHLLDWAPADIPAVEQIQTDLSS